MIRAIVVEDEIPARETLRSYLKRNFPQVAIMAEADRVSEAIQLVNENEFDLMFLDVQLNDGLGTEVLDGITGKMPRIIFTTAYDSYTQQAFKHKAFGYLLKPLDPDDFNDIMNRVVKDILFVDQTFSKIKLPHKTGYTVVELNDIVRCEAESNYTKLVTINGGPTVISKTLKIVETELLPEDLFIRTHKSHLINVNYIDRRYISPRIITLTTGEQIPVSRMKRDQVIDRLTKLGMDFS